MSLTPSQKEALKVMRLPAEYETLFINLSNTLSERRLREEDFDRLYQLAVESFDGAFRGLVDR